MFGTAINIHGNCVYDGSSCAPLLATWSSLWPHTKAYATRPRCPPTTATTRTLAPAPPLLPCPYRQLLDTRRVIEFMLASSNAQ